MFLPAYLEPATITRLRTLLGFDQRRMAYHLGLTSREYLSNIERGHNEVTASLAYYLTRIHHSNMYAVRGLTSPAPAPVGPYVDITGEAPNIIIWTNVRSDTSPDHPLEPAAQLGEAHDASFFLFPHPAGRKGNKYLMATTISPALTRHPNAAAAKAYAASLLDPAVPRIGAPA
jgi:transcriptional regulator with XRE-family HTH domain